LYIGSAISIGIYLSHFWLSEWIPHC